MEAHRSTTESREPWPPIVDECFRFQGSRPIFYMYVCHGKWSRERHMEQGRAFRTLPLSEPPGHDIVSNQPPFIVILKICLRDLGGTSFSVFPSYLDLLRVRMRLAARWDSAFQNTKAQAADEPRDHEWTAITLVRANTANLGPTMLDSSRASRIEKLALQPFQW
ncbi:hypothetical protein FOXB_10936 [Fusarium oxysporum f. sp. conglutinans Fo5176]|uniref:Uncharacterized protein n=1 Tax=Fusarium oxysporum (strain Fo5176) TaxID=660025 RepID=F9FX04_FUSOF|nr:hypothetical protein FOXB_10936 [Fusarium oxysporum f. sp. conglutinans Fo5176]